MTLRKIAFVGHPVLRQPCHELSQEELAADETQSFINDLIETMRDANGAGLAANQIYDSRRICAVEVSDNPRYPYKPRIPLTVVVNPVVTVLSDATFENFEGCLSVPNLRGRVFRYAEIVVEGWDRTGAPLRIEPRGLTAGTFQHELDHLDGKLFLDKISAPESLCTWEHFEAYERPRFEKEAAEIVSGWGG